MKNFYPVQFVDLRFQIDHISPEKCQLSEEYRVNPAIVLIFVL